MQKQLHALVLNSKTDRLKVGGDDVPTTQLNQPSKELCNCMHQSMPV